MRRGVLVVLATLVAFARPAVAAAPEGVVFEITPRAGAPREGTVTITETSPHDQAIVLWALVERAQGGGYTAPMSGSWFFDGGGRMRATIGAGRRLLVGGLRGRMKVKVSERGWTVRTVPRAFRVVTGTGGSPEDFTFASAPGGPGGSLVFAALPCQDGHGTWTLTAGEPFQLPRFCGIDVPDESREASTAVTWTLRGPVQGTSRIPYRLAVLDYPTT